MKTLRLILGDQLNSKHSWYKRVDDNVFYCMFEMRQETDYVRHHIQKVIGFFAAMREFSKQLVQNNHNVIYFNNYSFAFYFNIFGIPFIIAHISFYNIYDVV